MVLMEHGGKQVFLPLSDEKLMEISGEEAIGFFVPVENSELLYSDIGGLGLKQKLPRFLWLQEMNLLAYILGQFGPQQRERFREAIRPFSQMACGAMINEALAICPEAVGLQKGNGPPPQYTGENLFDLMEYKRFQDRLLRYPGFQIYKFYIPAYACIYYPDGSEKELTGAEAAAYRQHLSDEIAGRLRYREHWQEWESYPWLHSQPVYKELGILFERPDVETRNGELWGVIVAGAARPWGKPEMERLTEYFNEDIMEGRWNCLGGIEVPGGTLHVTFTECMEGCWQASLTKQEMFQLQAPCLARRVLDFTGFTPDFRDEWEYKKECPIWLELSHDRKTARISLPAGEDALSEAKRKVGAGPDAWIPVKLKAPGVFAIDNYGLQAIDLPTLNELAEEVRHMTKEGKELLDGSYMKMDGIYGQEIPFAIRTLREIRMQEVKTDDRKQGTCFGGMEPGM